MTHRILALQGAPSAVIQDALSAFARRRALEGLRVAGVVEERIGPEGPGCTGQALRDLATGRIHGIAQDLGPCAIACHLDSSGVADACHDVLAAIAVGCDIVVLSKFGKLEADRGGLLEAFGAAIANDVPVLTAVAPAFNERWNAFSAPFATFGLPEVGALERWWREANATSRAADIERMVAIAS
ncbi:DUF2478 domain-containing protein [Starkeya sp. ORNL1]|uniref:DUF2478 domain-containing protein n=1 Tax=Starkeya sp. ORNL1 TaxID=2709380 RepID=UPI001FED8653|nr:DUF2478 domain-containing protein [Starkeya sp. ORNL1]